MTTAKPLISGFTIKALLSQNTHADVYQVSRDNAVQNFAIKIAKTEFGSELISKEIGLLQQFSTVDGVISILETGKVDKFPYFLTPLYPQTLHSELLEHPQGMSYQQVLTIGRCLQASISALHQQGWLHGDLHPRNIMQKEPDDWLLIDFSAAHSLHQDSFTKIAPRMGNLLYSSPEQREGVLQLNQQSEVFSFAALMCTLLSGELHQNLFSSKLIDLQNIQQGSKEHRDINAKIQQAHQTWLAAAQIANAPKLLEILRKAMASNASERYASVTEFYQEFEKVCAEFVIKSSTNSDASTILPDSTVVFSHDTQFSKSIVNLKQSLIDSIIAQGKIDTQQFSELIKKHQLENSFSKPQEAVDKLAREAYAHLLLSSQHGPFLKWAENMRSYREKYGAYVSHENAAKLIDLGKQQGAGSVTKLRSFIYREFHVQSWFFAHKEKVFAITALLALLIYMGTSNTPVETAPVEISKLDFGVSGAFIKSKTPQADTQGEKYSVKTTPQRIVARYPESLEFTLTDPLTKAVYPLTFMRIGEASEFGNSQPLYAMSEEVSQGLWQACVNAGQCRQTKAFSTDPNRQQMLNLNHPVVNVNWYDVSEDFIPFLNQSLGTEFALPTIAEWLSFAYNSQGEPSYAARMHCKNCDNPSGEFLNSTVPINAFAPGASGLIHVYGNAQEWLQDCWQDVKLKIQRCDQAPAVGGAWLDTKQEIEQRPMSKLLKTARSMTTGFRLVKRETAK